MLVSLRFSTFANLVQRHLKTSHYVGLFPASPPLVVWHNARAQSDVESRTHLPLVSGNQQNLSLYASSLHPGVLVCGTVDNINSLLIWIPLNNSTPFILPSKFSVRFPHSFTQKGQVFPNLDSTNSTLFIPPSTFCVWFLPTFTQKDAGFFSDFFNISP